MIGPLLSAHKEFFNEHLFITFENLISKEALNRAQRICYDAIPLNSWESGRDLLTPREKDKKTFTTRKLSQFFHDLLKEPPRALIFDQLLPSPDLIKGKLPKFYEEDEIFLRDLFSLQGLNSALILCLQGGREGSVFYPESEGLATIVHGKRELPIASLKEMKKTCFLILGFGDSSTCFTHQELDPIAHVMKNKGIAPGDRIPLENYPSLPSIQ